MPPAPLATSKLYEALPDPRALRTRSVTSVPQFDPVRILHTLHAFGVAYIVIGGIAGVAHGSSLATFDLDVCYDRTRANADALASALKSLNARLRDLPEDIPFQLDTRTLLAGDHFTFTTELGDFDCIATPAGTSGYADLEANAAVMEIGGLSAKVASLDDLIRMKRATGRAKDRAALEILGALRDLLDEQPPHTV
jgi:hypothetical protein